MQRKSTGAITAAAAVAGVSAVVLGSRFWRERNAYDLRGRSVLITGGTRGLGFATACEFLKQGSRVAVCSRRDDEVQSAQAKLSQIGEAYALVCDLRAQENVRQMVADVRARLGPVDVLVNNAGVMQVGPWETMTQADYEEAMQVHFWAPLWATLEIVPGMIERHQGRILNISSIGGLVAIPHMLPYVSSKFALVGFSEGLRAELKQYGIRVTSICPWLMRTGSQEQAFFKGQHDKEFAWFAAGGSTALTAISAERAARRIVRACRFGEAQVVLALPGKLVALLHGVAPGIVINTLAVVDRMLPASGGIGTQRRSGGFSYRRLTEFLFRDSIRRAGARYNQPAAPAA